MTDEAPEADRLPEAPHPRDTRHLYGQDTAEAAFLQAFHSGRMHSGWLLTGPEGIGKATLAYRIAAFLLADDPGAGGGLFGDPAPATTLALPDIHPGFALIRADSHPRLFVLKRRPDDKTGRLPQQITVEAARELKGFFQLSAADGGRRVVIVDPADELNPSAANAILKLLEEPPRLTTLLLVSHRPAGLLPTIRSRCRTLRLNPLAPADLAAALDQTGTTAEAPEALAVLAGGSVGRAVQLAAMDGLALYADLVTIVAGVPRIDRTAAIRLAESCAGRGAEARFAALIDLAGVLFTRLSRAGLTGEPATQGAPGEARLLARLSPDPRAARLWATEGPAMLDRLRHGRAVNLDPAALVLDMCLRIEAVAATAPA